MAQRHEGQPLSTRKRNKIEIIHHSVGIVNLCHGLTRQCIAARSSFVTELIPEDRGKHQKNNCFKGVKRRNLVKLKSTLPSFKRV